MPESLVSRVARDRGLEPRDVSPPMSSPQAIYDQTCDQKHADSMRWSLLCWRCLVDAGGGPCFGSEEAAISG